MDSILYLLLELKRAQLTLTQLQSARTVRTEMHVRTNTVQTVKPVVSQPVVTPSPTPAPVATASAANVTSQIEQFVLEETNSYRAENGLVALTADSRVAAVARAHSADMLAQNYFEHVNRAGCNAGCRLTNAGYVWRTYGENIHWMKGYKLSPRDSAKKIVNDWINSPPHRTNLLGAFKYAGVGVAVSGDTIYSTTDYTTTH